MSHALVDHTADIALTLEAPDLAALFTEAALVLSSLVYGEAGAGDPAPFSLTVAVEAEDPGDLLVNWLREILYILTGQGRIIRRVDDLEITGHTDPGGPRLRAEIRAESFDPERHEMVREIKAATYHRLDVAYRDGCWCAFVVLDT